MRTKSLLLMAFLSAILLNACGGNANATPHSTEKIMSLARTAIALTSTAPPVLAKIDIIAPTTSVTQPTQTPPAANTDHMHSPAQQLENLSLPLKISNLPTTTPTTQTGAMNTSLCDGSAYVDDINVSDGSEFSPGEVFTKTWRIQNTGSCAWNKFYAIAFSSGESMSGETTLLGKTIQPNGTGNISVELTAPSVEGSHTGYWVMTNSNGTAFGSYVYVQIVVVADDAGEEDSD